MPLRRCLLVTCLAAAAMFPAAAEEKFEPFDRDPRWDGHNNRPDPASTREVLQDFGYSATRNSGDTPGEIGGTISPDGYAAYYAKVLEGFTFDAPFDAAGTIFVAKGPGNTFLGFFNHATLNEWRTPNTLGLRINQRGETFHVHSEYCTAKWRAGAGVIGQVDLAADRVHPIENPGDTRHRFSIKYRPDPDTGGGVLLATLGDVTSECAIPAEMRADGARFDRFGFLNIIKSVDSPGVLWMRDLEINGERVDLAEDPQWEGRNNRRAYRSDEVRPRFDIGYSPTRHAGGKTRGEIGGLFFRGDCREPDKLFYYGDDIGTLSLEDPLRIAGRVVLKKGVSDSTSLFGFFNAATSIEVNPAQNNGTPKDFFGFAIEGPSAEGFFVYPVLRGSGDTGTPNIRECPRIYPDGAAHDFAFTYDPAANGGLGEVTLTLDGQFIQWSLPEGFRAAGASFDRLGFVSPWIDGNGQRVYLDDLHYTTKKP